jgi:tetratricopeptide (TPR) repeat protein
MPDIALQTYNTEIKDLIDHGHFEEAIAHCQHILETFPKYIETYRLLAKAFLEQSRHGDAADVFQRVLSVEPDDWLSHVAMAIVREDESNLDMAIWHMERAYEVNPSNTTVQQEIRRLRGRRDGVEPPKLRLTRAALARMYIKGGLFSQAVAEIRAALVDDPDRPDLLALLASALYESGSLQEAADICNTLLKKLPFCREANRILGLVLWNTGKKDEAEKFFQRLAALDPYIDTDVLKAENRLAEHPAQGILLSRLEWEAQLKTDKTKQPSWAASLGIKIEESSSNASGLPDWLSTPAAPRTAAAPAPAFSSTPDWLGEATANAASASAASASGLPDWLAGSEAGASLSSSSSSLSSPASIGESHSLLSTPSSTPDWLHEAQSPVSETPAVTSDRLPAWASASLFGSPERAPESPLPPTPPLPDSSAIPDWARSEPASTASASRPSLKPDEPIPANVPDWIKKATTETPAAEKVTSALPDWLSAPPPPQVDALPASSLADWAKPEDAGTPPAAVTGQLPDWLSATRPREESQATSPDWASTLPKTDNEPAAPDWMQGIASVPQAETIKPEDVPDWLSPQPLSNQSEVIPDWMRPAGEVTPNKAATPAWMSEETTSSAIPDWMAPEPPELTSPTISPMETPSAPFPVEAKSQTDAVTPLDPMPHLQQAAEEVEPMPALSPITATPDWLTGTATPFESSLPPAIEELPPAVSVPSASADLGISLPDWLTEAVTSGEQTFSPAQPPPIQPVPALAPVPSEAEPTIPDWVTASTQPEETQKSALPTPALPDWLTSSAQPPTSQLEPPSAPAVQTPALAPTASSWAVESAPSRLATTKPEGIPTKQSSLTVPALPDWMKDSAPPAIGQPPIPVSLEAQSLVDPTVVSKLTQPQEQPTILARPEVPTQAPAQVEMPAANVASEPSVSAMPPIQAGIQSAAPIPITQSTSASASLNDVTQPSLPVVPPMELRAPSAVLTSSSPSNVPLPDWLRPVKPAASPEPIQDWDTAAQQLNKLPSAAPQPGAGMDSSQVADPVARWLDRRLKTSTLRSLDEVTMKGVPKTGDLGSQKPGTGALGVPRPGTGALNPPGQPSKGQVPTWLDYQRPGGSDTVVQWIDRRAPATGRLMEEKLQSPTGEKIPTKPLVKSSSDASMLSAPTNMAQSPAGSAVPEWLERVKKSDVGNAQPGNQTPEPIASGVTSSGAAAATGQAQIPSLPSAMTPIQNPIPANAPIRESQPQAAEVSKQRDANPPATVATPSSSGQPNRSSFEQEFDEDDGSPVPPPEWLQKALGKAVSDVPPIPSGKRESITWEDVAAQGAQQAPSKPVIPAKVPKYEQPRTFAPGDSAAIPTHAKRMSTQALSDGDSSMPVGQPNGVPIQKVVRTWQSPVSDEPPPASTVEGGKWVPIAPEENSAPQKRAPAAPVPVSPARPSKHKARKLNEVEAEALLREARIYLDTDLAKAATVYQRVLELPVFAEMVSKDLETYLEQDPESAALWNLLGDALTKSGRLTDAYRAYEESLRRMG